MRSTCQHLILLILLCLGLVPSAQATEKGKTQKADLFIRPELSLKKGYVGQKIDYTLKLYSTDPNIAGVQPLEHILPKGCDVRVVNDLKDPYVEGRENINGRQYTVVVLERKIVEPLSTGTLVIPPINYNVLLREKVFVGNDFFWGPIYDNVDHEFTVKSQTLKLSVKEMPKNQPECFSGAIGEFSVSVTAARGPVIKNEENRVFVKVMGTGSLDDIEPVSIADLSRAWGDKIAIRSVTDNEDSYWQDGRYISEKEYEVVFVPSKTGSVELPPVEFCYFNPVTGRFETAISDPLSITVRNRKNQSSEPQIEI